MLVLIPTRHVAGSIMSHGFADMPDEEEKSQQLREINKMSFEEVSVNAFLLCFPYKSTYPRQFF